jgi:hypothetical protein
MSIQPSTILASLLRQKRLFERPSNYTGFETVRKLYVVPEILAVTAEPFGDTLRDQRLAEFAQTLDAFSEGGRVSVAANPRRKPPDAMLARVDPAHAEFWCMRVTEPEQTPGIRALGAFVEKDAFALLTWHFREQMSFDDDVTEVRQTWTDLFRDGSPHRGPAIDAYLSNYWEV